VKRKIYLLAAIFVFSVAIEIHAQRDSTYKISAELLGGSSIATINVYDEDDMNIIGFTGGFRLIFEPDRLLRVGIEGGLLHLAHSKEENIQTEFGLTKRSNSLNAYPIMLHFDMKVWKFDVMLGLGVAIISSKIFAFNDVSESSVITSSKMYGVGYTFPVTERFSLGCEFKYYSFSTPGLTVATVQLKSKYSIFIW
jgi:hypothetical protein